MLIDISFGVYTGRFGIGPFIIMCESKKGREIYYGVKYKEISG